MNFMTKPLEKLEGKVIDYKKVEKPFLFHCCLHKMDEYARMSF
jgi:hypothetical protein